MNSGINALGQGNRANATIGRALQLIVRNVGGGRPGELDRADAGRPRQVHVLLCRGRDATRHGSRSPRRAGSPQGANAVTLFQGDGIQGFIDQRSRTPEELTSSLAMSLAAVGHHKLCEFTNAMLVLVPEHYAIYRAAGWDRARITKELHAASFGRAATSCRGAQGVGEGIDARARTRWSQVLGRRTAHRSRGRRGGTLLRDLAGWTGGRFPRPIATSDEGDHHEYGVQLRDPTAETASEMRARTGRTASLGGRQPSR